MTARIAALLASTFFAVSACGAAASAGVTAGAVYVTTLPAGADVWIDGTYVGRAPVLVDALVPGHHALTVTRTGWQAQEVDVSVPSGGIAMSSTRLMAGPLAFAGTPPGSVIVRDPPPGATLALDGAPFGAPAGRSVALPAGPHRISITTPKGRTTRSFVVLPGTSTDLVLRNGPVGPEAARSAVLAPADDYVGADAYVVEGQKIVMRTSGHVVIAHFGDPAIRYDGVTAAYDAAPTTIGGKLYMPLALLEKLSDDMSKSP